MSPEPGKDSRWTRWQVPAMAARPALTLVSEPPAGRAATPPEHPEQARLAAWQEGLARGLAEGRELGLAELRTQGARLAQLVARLEQPFASQDDAIAHELLALATVLARQLVRHELSLHPEHILRVVQDALAALPAARQQVTLLLHPDDAALVRASLADDDGTHAIHLVESLALTRGDCQLQTDEARIDERLDVRLDRLVHQMLGEPPHPEVAA